VTRSITRKLADRFVAKWLVASHSNDRVMEHDLTANPLPVVNEEWLVATFGDPMVNPTPKALELSNTLISALI
jgi:FMN-dependent NADH-azoreductase